MRFVLPAMALGRLTPERAERLLARAAGGAPVAAARIVLGSEEVPSGGDRRARTIGQGDSAFGRAADCVRHLGMQRSVAQVWPAEAVVVEGAHLLVALRFGPMTVIAVNRIAAVVDEPGRFGFVYTTLRGHPEVGEEAFVVELRPDGSVVASITVWGDVALPLGRLLRPILHPLQVRFAERYLDALAAAAHRPLQDEDPTRTQHP